MADEVIEKTPKSKDEMRHEPHEFKDNNGWCAVCSRGEGWKAHGEAEDKVPVAEAPAESEAIEEEEFIS